MMGRKKILRMAKRSKTWGTATPVRQARARSGRRSQSALNNAQFRGLSGSIAGTSGSKSMGRIPSMSKRNIALIGGGAAVLSMAGTGTASGSRGLTPHSSGGMRGGML